MGVQIAEMAGGFALLAVELLAIWAVAETACQIFFKIREREKSGE
jgi:hypothetical protein